MKMNTAWWGIQLLAETDEDKDVLDKLILSLPNGADCIYEHGTIEVVDENNTSDNLWVFSKEEISDSKMVIEINR